MCFRPRDGGDGESVEHVGPRPGVQVVIDQWVHASRYRGTVDILFDTAEGGVAQVMDRERERVQEVCRAVGLSVAPCEEHVVLASAVDLVEYANKADNAAGIAGGTYFL